LNSINLEKSPASFRDPSGYIFSKNDQIYRTVSFSYKDNYDFLISSGLYNKLISDNLLINHEEIDSSELVSSDIYKILKPSNIDFISYPYEWSFSQLKDAALLTLKIQQIALDHEMSLKDASAFNIQFQNGSPIFIDTLSFEKYSSGKLWNAYRQFCMLFLSPLILMKYNDLRMNRLLSLYIDGIPLNMTRSLLPVKSFFRPSIFSHIYLHSLSEKHSPSKKTGYEVKITKNALYALIDNLKKAIQGLRLGTKKSTWGCYYFENSYTQSELEKKKDVVQEYIGEVNPSNMIDLGANIGLFSRIASSQDIYTISTDYDPYCVELNYLEAKKNKEEKIFPLFIDLTNPSSDLGWNGMERSSFLKRKNVDVVMVLALIHHLSISNNVPFDELARCFSQMADHLIIEFVPKQDIQVKSLLVNREDIYDNYYPEYFEKVFGNTYSILRKETVTQSGRTLYLMKLR